MNQPFTFRECGHGCKCACPDGPCEHKFEGWEEFSEENPGPMGITGGGTTICSKCGMSAVSHSLRVGP